MTAIGLFDNNGHLTKTALEALHTGTLCDEALDCVLAHIGSCEKCADLFASGFDDSELSQPPAGFCEELNKRLKSSGGNGKRSLALYALRVSIAACAALIITFSGSLGTLANKPAKIPDSKTVNSISTHLKTFSQHLVNMEVFNYDKQEK